MYRSDKNANRKKSCVTQVAATATLTKSANNCLI